MTQRDSRQIPKQFFVDGETTEMIAIIRAAWTSFTFRTGSGIRTLQYHVSSRFINLFIIIDIAAPCHNVSLPVCLSCLGLQHSTGP